MSSINKFGESSIKHKINNKGIITKEYLEKTHISLINEINYIKRDVQKLKESLTKDINKDVETIENVIKSQVISTNKKLMKSIEERFNNIETYIFKNISKSVNVDDIKKRKIEFPIIKTA